MPHHASTSVAAVPNSLTRVMAVAVPLCFCLWQVHTGMGSNSRITAPALKVSLRVVAVCIVSAAMLACSLTTDEDPMQPRNRAHRSGASTTTVSTVYSYNAFATAQQSIDEAKMRTLALRDVYSQSVRLLECSTAHAKEPDPWLHILADALIEFGQPRPVAICDSPARAETECSTPSMLPSVGDSDNDDAASVGERRVSWPSSTCDPSREATPTHSIKSPTLPPAHTPQPRAVLYAYRHNPYSFRGYTRVDVPANNTTVPLNIVKSNGATQVLEIPVEIVLKPQQVSIDLRRRGRANPKTDDEPVAKSDPTATSTKREAKDKSSPPQQAVAKNPLSTARKNMKKTYEGSGMQLSEPLYPMRFDAGNHTPCRAKLDRIIDARKAHGKKDVADELHDSTTMTGLPNVDGHRVAAAILDHYVACGVVVGGYAFATTERRTDRFNTGACHVNFNRVDDAQRVQTALRTDMLFAAFRDGTCVITTARA